jgi:hypothetical protein
MPQVAERVHMVQRRPAAKERRPPVAELQPSRSTGPARTRGSISERVASPVSEIVGGLPTRLRAGVESLSGIAMDDVRVHRNSSEPAKLGALAFTRGTDIHLGPGQEEHLPHEAWHVVQQKQGRVQATTQMKGAAINDDAGLEREADRMAPRTLSEARPITIPQKASIQSPIATQLRRVPSAASISAEFPASGSGFESARIALARILSRTWAALPAVQQVLLANSPPAGLAWTNEESLQTALLAASRSQIVAFADALRAAHPSSALGDINLMETGARAGTSDAANLSILLSKANAIYDDIAGGNRDRDLADVFGSSKVATAKGKYAKSKVKAAQIIRGNKVISDRSGFSDEVGLGGVSSGSKISLLAEFVDNPSASESIVSFIHECAHAGNPDVDDFGYISDPTFTRQSTDFKLKNAAHYEVAPRRKLGLEPTFTGVVFVPASSSSGASRPLTPEEQVLRSISEIFRKAWDRSVDLHQRMVEFAVQPRKWYTDTSARTELLAWSLLAKLTLHKRIGAFPPTWVVGTMPVSQLDIALSEGMVRKIDLAKAAAPNDSDEVALQISIHASSTEKADLAATTSAAARARKQADLSVLIVLRSFVRSLTGTLGGDRQLIRYLVRTYRT